MSEPTEIQRFVQDISRPEYLLAASLGLIPGVDVNVKFGHSPATTAVRSDLWERAAAQPVYIFPVDAGEGATLVSTQAADTQLIVVEGLDENGVPKSESKNLTGLVPVALTGLWRSISRAYVEDSTEITGVVTVQGDGGVSTNVFAVIDTDDQQTSQTPYVVPAGKVAVVVNYSTAINKLGGVEISTLFGFRVAKAGKVFRTKIRYGLEQTGTSNISSDLVIPVLAGPLSKMKITAEPSSAPADISGEYSMLLIDSGLVPAAVLAAIS